VISEKIKRDDFKYQSSSEKEWDSFKRNIESKLTMFISQKGIDLGLDRASIKSYECILKEIECHIDKSKDYYHYFHTDARITRFTSETRGLSLLCYWIIKYKPFHLDDIKTEAFWKKHHCTINERFALFLIETFVYRTYFAVQKKDIHFFTPENRKVILYNFTHRDLSKEAFILFIGSLISTFEL